MKILTAPPHTPWIIEYLTDLWGSTNIYLPNGNFNAAALPALYTEDREVVLTYHIGERADIVTFNVPFGYEQDIVNKLIKELRINIRKENIFEVFSTTCNDHLDLMAYLQSAGFRFHHIYKGAIDTARQRHPSIPEIGRFDIPMRDEIEFILTL